MKKLLLVSMLCLLILAGCGEVPTETVVIDGCEYIKCSEGITHKGDCSLCEARDIVDAYLER